MTTTNTALEKATDDDEPSTECDHDWCDGPDGDTLPCFACFDPNRDYDRGVDE